MKENRDILEIRKKTVISVSYTHLDVYKRQVAFPLTNSWYTPAFYIGNGCTLFGDGTDESKGVDFAGEKAVSVTEYLVEDVYKRQKAGCIPSWAALLIA